jgi:hypothetical protein
MIDEKVPTQSLKPQPRKVFGDVPPELDEIKTRLNDLVDAFVFQSGAISIDSNFNGFIAKNVTIASGATVKIQHFLGVIPKWRIILRQTGNGVITDVPSEWDKRTISLKNNGVESVTISVLIARE